jgi:hypothetical protein
MVRFALSPEGAVVPDVRQRLPGRGVWTRANRAIVRQATSKQAFSRGFKASVKAGPELADDVDRLLEDDALRFLSLVNKAGLVITGGAKVEAAIRDSAAREPLVGLMRARDGADDGAGKLERLLSGVLGARAEAVTRINLFESRQLDLALGRTNVIHAALRAGPASEAFLARVARLRLYRVGEAASSTVATADVGHEATDGIDDTSRE